jgi:hypothetical protein
VRSATATTECLTIKVVFCKERIPAFSTGRISSAEELGKLLADAFVFTQFQVEGITVVLVVPGYLSGNTKAQMLVETESLLVRCSGMTGYRPVSVGNLCDELFALALAAGVRSHG